MNKNTKRKHKQECEVCEVIFYSKRSVAYYCSDRCRQISCRKAKNDYEDYRKWLEEKNKLSVTKQ